MRAVLIACILSVCILGISTSGYAAPQEVGSAEWSQNGVTHEYKIYQYPGADWDSASNWVTSVLGSSWHLATITSVAEQSFFNTTILPSAGGEMWIGGVQDPITTTDPAANWTWVTGEPWSFTNWSPGEPNDARCCGSRPEQHLGILEGGGWNDEGYLSNIYGFVAETTTHACVEPAPGMRNWWPGDGNAADVIGGHNGTLQNGATYATGLVGQAFSFNDAYQQYVKVPHSADLDLKNALTIEAWVMKTGGCAPLNCFIVAKGNQDFSANTQNGRYGLLIYNPMYGPGRDSRVALSFNTGIWQDVVYGTTKIQDNTWYHVAGTWDGSTAKIYVNGALENSAAKTGTILDTTNNGSLTIGAEIFADGWIPQGEYFHGSIDEVEIFNRALTAEEIRSIYRAGNAGTCKAVNRPPTANAGLDQTRELASCAGASVLLDGSGSSDIDGDALTYTWVENNNVIATGVGPAVTLSSGIHRITLTVDDGKGGAASDEVVITVADTTTPSLAVTLNPNVLWPPNHKYVKTTPSFAIADACREMTTVNLLSVSSNEPDNGLGDGDTGNDIVVNDDGTLSLRAERSGKGSGRVYTITYQATDGAGNSTTASAFVTVPHNK
jgi:concanavalin A-like lectin/glucanase superfamily protein/PKD domain-containing protein